jgi:hypothetical protein
MGTEKEIDCFLCGSKNIKIENYMGVDPCKNDKWDKSVTKHCECKDCGERWFANEGGDDENTETESPKRIEGAKDDCT